MNCKVLKILKKNAMNLKIFSNNIRSISKNFDELSVFLEDLDSSIDCIVLTESRKI